MPTLKPSKRLNRRKARRIHATQPSFRTLCGHLGPTPTAGELNRGIHILLSTAFLSRIPCPCS